MVFIGCIVQRPEIEIQEYFYKQNDFRLWVSRLKHESSGIQWKVNRQRHSGEIDFE